MTSLPSETATPAKNIFQRLRMLPKAHALLLLTLLAVMLAGLLLSPPGLLGKADAIGYAVCHRIDLRSLHLGERQMPLCARCTGTFLGTIVGALLLIGFGRGRSAAWPRRGILILLALTAVPWGLDGLNSYVSLFPRLPHVYEPQNWLRLTTGMLLGFAMAAVFVPAVNQSLWKSPSSEPVIRGFRELIWYFLPAPILIGLALTENPIILYPLAILSVAGILFLLTGVYTALLLMALRREGLAESWAQAWPSLAAGFLLGLLQIYAIDAVRFQLTRTWGGFGLGG
ncbi:MAG: DUF2085 domain-containing protein [Anaerolineales bacterium]|nr:DUF2085 domain-containing protein [Anaerolineales bacterium]